MKNPQEVQGVLNTMFGVEFSLQPMEHDARNDEWKTKYTNGRVELVVTARVSTAWWILCHVDGVPVSEQIQLIRLERAATIAQGVISKAIGTSSEAA